MKIIAISAALREIGQFLKKALEIMACRGGKRGTEGTVRSVPDLTKRARMTRATSSAVPEYLASLRGENEELRRQLQTLTSRTQDILSQLELCQSQLSTRDHKIVTLEKNAIAADRVRLDLEKRVAKMQQQLCKELEECGSYADGKATPFLLESTLNLVQMSVSSFTKVFLDYAKSHSIQAIRALTKHFESPFLTRPGHVTYLLKAWTFKALFLDFENESFRCDGTSIFLDYTERRIKSFEHFEVLYSNAGVSHPCAADWYEQFCRQKLRDFLSLWQSSDQITSRNLSSEVLEDPGAEESKVRLMASFRSAAKTVLALHKLSLSFPTRAEIFRVSQHNEFSAEYMESVVSREDDKRFTSKIGFMICPGFRLNRSVFKCQIYLARDPNVSD